MRERASSFEYFEWFRRNADFGPADSEVVAAMNERFMDETGKNLPEGTLTRGIGNQDSSNSSVKAKG